MCTKIAHPIYLQSAERKKVLYLILFLSILAPPEQLCPRINEYNDIGGVCEYSDSA
jgi:hypothetical protein